MIHGWTVIDPSVVLGERASVYQFASILEGTVIGDDCVIGSSVWIGRNCRIGNGVRFQDKAHITNGAVIEDDVFIGPAVVTMDDKYPRVRNPRYRAEPPIIRRAARIGGGAILLPGVEIGEGAFVAAGAVITRSIPPGGTAIGVPGRLKLASVA